MSVMDKQQNNSFKEISYLRKVIISLLGDFPEKFKIGNAYRKGELVLYKNTIYRVVEIIEDATIIDLEDPTMFLSVTNDYILEVENIAELTALDISGGTSGKLCFVKNGVTNDGDEGLFVFKADVFKSGEIGVHNSSNGNGSWWFLTPTHGLHNEFLGIEGDGNFHLSETQRDQIEINKTDIATNVTDIATNVTDIATNVTDIESLNIGTGRLLNPVANNTALSALNTDITYDNSLCFVEDEGLFIFKEGATAGPEKSYSASNNSGAWFFVVPSDGSHNELLGIDGDGDGTFHLTEDQKNQIATNETNIATNTGNISTNAGDISTNATDISNLQAGLGRVLPSVQTTTNLTAIPTDITYDKSLCFCEDIGLYSFDFQSTETANTTNIINSHDSAGRWLLISVSLSDHNNLSNLQGGNTTERYHLTSDEKNKITTNENNIVNLQTGFGKILDSVNITTDLTAILTDITYDKTICFVESKGLYYFDFESIEVVDNDTIINGNGSNGRWLILASKDNSGGHNDLDGKDGGDSTGYFHLTLSEHTQILLHEGRIGTNESDIDNLEANIVTVENSVVTNATNIGTNVTNLNNHIAKNGTESGDQHISIDQLNKLDDLTFTTVSNTAPANPIEGDVWIEV